MTTPLNPPLAVAARQADLAASCFSHPAHAIALGFAASGLARRGAPGTVARCGPGSFFALLQRTVQSIWRG
jgi:hypothetical protein